MSEQRRYDTPYVPPDMSGTLKRNRYKKPGSKEPDLRGDVTVNGVQLELAGWEREDRNGNPYWSLKFSEPRGRAPRQESKPPLDDDSIPF